MELKDIVKEAVIINENATFREALTAMVKQQTNTLLVTDSEGLLVGEVGVSDLMDAIVPEYLDGDSIAANFATEEMFEAAVQTAADKGVQDFMTVDIDPVHIDDGLVTVAATAIAHQRARIPVIDHDNRPIGIISRRGLKQLLGASLGIPNSK
ncbi:MAG: CBS domain-containing protein [Candidatus Paceibacterota bacterium]